MKIKVIGFREDPDRIFHNALVEEAKARNMIFERSGKPCVSRLLRLILAERYAKKEEEKEQAVKKSEAIQECSTL